MESLLSHGNVCTGKGLYKFNIFYYFIKCFYELLCKAFILVRILLAGSNRRPTAKCPEQ